MATTAAGFIPVVMCGGPGARLWPLSRTQLAKPFVELPGGGTMIGNLLASLADLDCAETVLVAGAAQVKSCQEAAQAAGCKATVLAEPEGRNTAPALATAARYIEHRHGPEAVAAVLPADHHVADREKFNAALAAAAACSKEGRIVMLGVAPTRPETGYGYIQAEIESGRGWGFVDRFVEKPSAARAAELLAAGGHYWNAGVFVAPAGVFAAELDRHAPEVMAVARRLDFAQGTSDGVWRPAPEIYAEYPAVSFDHAVAERTEGAAVVPLADAGWSDVGSWEEFAKLMPADAAGNRLHGDAVVEGSAGVAVVAAGGRTVAVAGVDKVAVVDTPDAVLVAGAGAGEAVRKVRETLAVRGERCTQSPAFEKRPWGVYRQLGAGPGWQVKRIEVAPGKRLSLQSHRHRAEHWTVVAGTMTVTIDERQLELGPDESCYIPLGAKHRMANAGAEPAVLIEVQCGSYLGEDDIERYEDDFGRS